MSSSIKTGPVQIYHIDSKALIEDKKKDDSHSVSIDVFYSDRNQIRLEVSAILGVSVGSLLMNPQQIQYSLPMQKVFVQGPFAARTLKPLFKQEIDPRWLWAVIYNHDLKKYGLSCQTDEFKNQTCQHVSNVGIVTTIKTEPRPDNLRKILIENDSFKFVWIFKSIEKHNKSYNETFVLAQPEDYRLVTIK